MKGSDNSGSSFLSKYRPCGKDLRLRVVKSAVGQNGVEMHLKVGLSWAQEVQGPRGAKRSLRAKSPTNLSINQPACECGVPEGWRSAIWCLAMGTSTEKSDPSNLRQLNACSVGGGDVTQLPGLQGAPFLLNRN